MLHLFPSINLTVKHVNSEYRALASVSLDSSARVTLIEENKKTGTRLSGLFDLII